ncbi:MAG: GNAT family N-acetyltransferase [Bacteroidales bacterium]|nr:GNAT family N-acetyltransferase [Bacteroidales bacterium]
MKKVIPPVDSELIEQELTRDKFLRATNNASNELYIITHHDSPNTMREIGRLREITFRLAGGGTGKEMDIDRFDTCENPYKQLIVWDPQQKDILGGYRYIMGEDVKPNEQGEVDLATSRLFHFSQEFIRDYIPYTIELGRSFVQPAYQSSNRNKKSLFALDNLWDGLGAIFKDNPQYKYFFGKVTMYTSYQKEARDLILSFMNKHFKGSETLMYPYKPLSIETDQATVDSILTSDNFKDDMKLLSQAVRARGEVIPPLINAYINLSPTLQCFGTVLNTHFGDVEETAILLTMSDMYPAKIERHIDSYHKV